MFDKRALIVGVTGIVGNNLAGHLHRSGGWQISGLSRRPPIGASHIDARAVDLLDRRAVQDALKTLDPTHVYFCTWTRGVDEDDNIAKNSLMMSNLLESIAGKSVQHVALVTGTKHYLGPFESYAKNDPVTPFREEQPRLPLKNFYYNLEDMLFAGAERLGYGWSVHRAHTIVGYAVGNLMNIGVTLACHATICRETGRPFFFPGHPVQYRGVVDFTDARLLARHLAWASTTPAARNEAFNVANGEQFRWNQLWPQLAAYFSIEAAPYPEQHVKLEDQMRDAGSTWDRIVAKYGLQPNTLDVLASPWHTDLDLGRPMECFNSMAKSRRYGFTDTQESHLSFIELFDQLRRERIIP